MKDFRNHPIELDSSMVEYLQDAAKTYDLSDLGKAVRCLVNYARENPDKRDEIFGAVRCLEC